MKAVILAGGAGSRLSPLTLDRPAALLPVANRPIVAHLLDHLVRHRVSEATLALHHHPYPLEACLGDGTRWGLRLRYVLERAPLGTAGATRRAAARWTEPFLVAAATALTTADVTKAATFHQDRGAALTLIVTSTTGTPGDVELDDESRVELPRVPGAARFATSGLMIVSPAALEHVPTGQPCDLVTDLVPRLTAAGLVVAGYVAADPGIWVRTPADLLAANRLAIATELPGLVLPGFEVRRGVWRCHGALVHPQARLVPPVMVGANAVIGRGAVVEGAVVGDDVIVGGGSVVRRSLLLAGTHVGRDLRVEDAVVDRERLGHVGAGTWVTVSDPRILGDTRAPILPWGGSIAGRLLAAGLLVGTAPLWALVLAALALETRGRPFRPRPIVSARGGVSALPRLATRGPLGRRLARLGLTRMPYLWSIVRGDLLWVGATARGPEEWEALVARGELPLAPPGFVTLADLAPAPLGRSDRLALDRLHAAERSRRRNVRLVLTVALRRLGLPAGAFPSDPPAA